MKLRTLLRQLGRCGGLAALAAPALAFGQTAQVVFLGRSGGIEAPLDWQGQSVFGASGISPNGQFFAGTWSRRVSEIEVRNDPAIWSWTDGIEVLGSFGGLGNLNYGEAARVTDDGRRAVGHERVDPFNFYPFVWNRDTGREFLPLPIEIPLGYSYHVHDASADCSIAVGSTFLSFGDTNGNDAIAWDTVARLPRVITPHDGVAVSADGTTFVGYELRERKSWVWRVTDDRPAFIDVSSLRDLLDDGHAEALSDDGRTVVGTYRSTVPHPFTPDDYLRKAFLWTREGGAIDLGPSPCPSDIAILGTSSDASVVLGSVGCSAAAGGVKALVWTLPHGWRELQPLLAQDYGVAIPNAHNFFVAAMSEVAPAYAIRVSETPAGTPATQAIWANYAVRLPAGCEPQIQSGPDPVTSGSGGTATFTASATHMGSSPLGYVWRRDGVALNDGLGVTGARTPTLILEGVRASDSGAYDCLVVNLCGSRATAPTQLTITGCLSDFNGSGGVTVQDIFDFLNDYFSATPRADVNRSGTVTVQDIFDYLNAYFAGC